MKDSRTLISICQIDKAKAAYKLKRINLFIWYKNSFVKISKYIL